MKDDIFLIKVPQLDESVSSATVVEWYISDGAIINEGDSICAIETSKAVFDIEADQSGCLVHLVEEGQEVLVSTPIGIIGLNIELANKEKEKYLIARSGDIGNESPASNIKATEKAKKLASKHNIDLADINSDGIIKKKDVLMLLENNKEKDQTNNEMYYDIESTIELVGNRKAGKELMLESIRNIPQSFVEKEINTTELERYIKDYASNEGKYITTLSVILFSLGKALKEYKILNSYREDNKLFIYKRINVGVIINHENNISIPVIKDIDQLPPLEIVKKLFGMRKDIMIRKPKIDDLVGGTFSVSAMDHTDVKRFIPIV